MAPAARGHADGHTSTEAKRKPSMLTTQLRAEPVMDVAGERARWRCRYAIMARMRQWSHASRSIRNQSGNVVWAMAVATTSASCW